MFLHFLASSFVNSSTFFLHVSQTSDIYSSGIVRRALFSLSLSPRTSVLILTHQMIYFFSLLLFPLFLCISCTVCCVLCTHHSAPPVNTVMKTEVDKNVRSILEDRAFPQFRSFRIPLDSRFHAEVNLILPPALREAEYVRFPLVVEM